MDFSAANISLWDLIIQMGIIAVALLFSNFLRRKLRFIRKSYIPVSVIAGFILCIIRNLGLEFNWKFQPINGDTLEMLTYHGIAIGFIALSLRIEKENKDNGERASLKSGALIASTYVIQGITGLLISLLLAYTFMPNLFKSSGILLPMGYGQGPGQANNIGLTFENLGFKGGQSFGLSLAAAGYLSACIVGIIVINVLSRKGKIKRSNVDTEFDTMSVADYRSNNEIPVSESMDKLSVQISLVLIVYFATFLLTWGVTSLLTRFLPGVAGTANSLLWGFNFIIGALLATLFCGITKKLHKKGIMKRQYQNNYLLSRISGFAFDVMIVCGITTITFSDLKELWIPFIIMAVLGAVVTLIYLFWISKYLYKGYRYEGMLSMYGMMTGTISSGVLLLKEVDNEFKTPAANNLVGGSCFAIIFGAPVLVLVGLAPKSDLMTWITLGILVVYFAVLVVLLRLLSKGKKKNDDSGEQSNS